MQRMIKGLLVLVIVIGGAIAAITYFQKQESGNSGTAARPAAETSFANAV